MSKHARLLQLSCLAFLLSLSSRFFSLSSLAFFSLLLSFFSRCLLPLSSLFSLSSLSFFSFSSPCLLFSSVSSRFLLKPTDLLHSLALATKQERSTHGV